MFMQYITGLKGIGILEASSLRMPYRVQKGSKWGAKRISFIFYKT